MKRKQVDNRNVRVTVRLTQSESDLLYQLAEDEAISVSELIRKAIKYYMDYHVD